MSEFYRASNGAVFADRLELDAAYDVEGAVEDFGVYVDFFVNTSERARRDLRCELDISYGPTRAETLDIFPGEPGGPVVIFIHGGYWRTLTSKEFSLVAPGLVSRGATVVIPNYALLPSVTIDEIVRQMRAAVAWVHDHIAEYGGDPKRLLVSGHSAGGHLTAMLLDTDWEAEYGMAPDCITAGCAISGLYDLRPLAFTSMQQDFRFTGEEILRNSPQLGLPRSAPPLLITYGVDQPSEFARQSEDFYAAWRGAGLEAELWAREGLNHFDELEAFGEPGSELVERLMALLEQGGHS
ncbi:alpha/beta hydrolase [Leucobacter tenebrionis]|uniref:alpha/beta hydrolase n=1 Tax=Leucobacter tenebrionis TaxID=2873270 RepID=UPI001CA6F158|nr:alpha/beta hydrolase [Leucobacter tenebrionis]QZY50714.1 alpha/beta hydrolase [Leucobacter tenebrionis]